ncbi:MAG TPA: glycosyltransferase family 4 protein [Humisphaera sp.]
MTTAPPVDDPTAESATDRGARAAPPHAIEVLAVGMGWFPETGNGGLDRVFHDLLAHLPAVGARCRALTTGTPAVARHTGGAVRAFAPESAGTVSRMRAVRHAVADAIRERRPDVVATHFALYAYPVLRRLAKLPLVVHFQGPWGQESLSAGGSRAGGWAKGRIERIVYRRADRLIVLTDAFGRVLREQFGVPAARIRVVPPGVDVDRFDVGCGRREARERLGWPADRPVVLAVRRLVPRMGLDDLVSAMTAVRARVPDAMLMIAGRGPMRDELTRRVAEAGLADHVRLLGFVPDDDLPLAYRAADVSVVPTVRWEGFGLIAAESLAAGTPSIVTPVDGLPDVVRDLSEALVLPTTGPAAIASRVADALRGRVDLPDAAACRAYARSRFAWPAAARRVRDVYAEAAGIADD